MVSDDLVKMPLADTIIEVNNQPKIVANALQNNHELIIELAQLIVEKEISKIQLLGSGDSMFLGYCVQQAFNTYANIPMYVSQAYEYAVLGDIGIQKDTIIFVVSSSGRISTTRDALARALKSEAFVVGVTDDTSAENPFFTLPSKVLVPGGCKKGWPTQTTTATMVLFYDLAIQIGRFSGFLSETESADLFSQLEKTIGLMGKVLDQSKISAVKIAEKFIEDEVFYFIGSGPGYGVASIGGALAAEGPQRLGVPFYVEEFHHSLRINTVEMGMPVFLIAPQDPSYSRYLDTVKAVKNWGGYLIALINESDDTIPALANMVIKLPGVPWEFNPLLSLMPLHLFSIELTKFREARGYQRPWYTV